MAWSRVNPIPIIMTTASSLGTKLPDFLLPPPGGTKGDVKSERNKKTFNNLPMHLAKVVLQPT